MVTKKATKKNIILITVDCLRADRFGFLNYEKKITPHIDLLANENGIIFTQAFSNATHTIASVSSFLTGTYPLYKGNVLINDRTTIPELLKKDGYNTAAFHSNAIISQNPNDYKKGFNTFEDVHESHNLTNNKNSLSNLFNKFNLVKGWEFVTKISRIFGKNRFAFKYIITKVYFMINRNSNSPYASADTLNKKVISWLDQNSSSPFFLWMHYMDVHAPYSPPEKIFADISDKKYSLPKGYVNSIKASDNYYTSSDDDKKYLMDLYDSSIKHVDQKISEIFAYLENNDLLNNTYVILTADHGEEFWDHGHYGHGGGLAKTVKLNKLPRPIKIYNESIHVPLFFFGGGIKSNVVDKPVSLVDMAATIVDLSNIDIPSTFDGKSLVNSFEKDNCVNEDYMPIISEAIDPWNPSVYTNHPLRSEIISYRINEWKYIYYSNGEQSDELYNIDEDSKEKMNLIDIHPDIASDIKTKILIHLKSKNRLSKKVSLKNKLKTMKTSGRL